MTSAILTPATVGNKIVEGWPDGLWQFQEPLELYALGLRVDIPARYLTDFASTPRILWPILPPWDDEYNDSSGGHDRLYETHQAFDVRMGQPVLVTREMADQWYRAHVRCGALRRQMLYTGVRLGGAGFWESGPRRQQARLAKLRREGWG